MELRGAVAEDLQLPPPLPVYADLSLSDARELAYERWPATPPVVGVLSRSTSRLVGYLEGFQLESDLADDFRQRVVDHMRVVHTPKRVAISAPVKALVDLLSTVPIAEVTDSDNKHMLATVTRSDLERRNIRLEG